MKRLTRSRTDRKIAGVCGGMAELLGWDPTIVRLAAVFVGVATGVAPLLFAYVVAWIIVPEDGTVSSFTATPPPPPQHSAGTPPAEGSSSHEAG